MCEYCKAHIAGVMTPLFDNEGDCDEPAVYIEGGCLALEYQCVVDYVEINYCPMCGRDLRGAANERG